MQEELNDKAWDGLIRISLKHQNRLGKFHSIRYDRQVVYTAANLRELAVILVNSGVIQRWQGGSRRLQEIERSVMLNFRAIHGKYHNDP